MKYKKSAIFAGSLMAVLAAGAIAYFADGSLGKDPKSTGASATSETAALEKASFKFAIMDIERNGNLISFTIPEDARTLEKKADAVVLSGLYVSGAHSQDCPVVQSDAVDKSVENYSPMSGKARVTANFDDENMAKAALEKGCLLINDPT